MKKIKNGGLSVNNQSYISSDIKKKPNNDFFQSQSQFQPKKLFPINENTQISMTSPKYDSSFNESQTELRYNIKRNRIYNNYNDFINNLKELNEIKKNKEMPKKNYNLSRKFISDYKYYKSNVYSSYGVKKISFSKFKSNIIKSRINDYLSLDSFFTTNKDLLINIERKKPRKSSIESKYLEPLFKSYSNMKGGKNFKKKLGGALKDDGKDFLSVMHILDSKHDFYDNVSQQTRDYMNKLYDTTLTTLIKDPIRKDKLRELYGNTMNTSKDPYYEENILVETVSKISEGKLIDDINDYGNFEFIDVNNDSTKFIYYPTIDDSKVVTENNVDNDTILKIIRDYFGYDSNPTNYKYMYDTKIFINNEISQVLSNKNVTVFGKIANQCKPFENGYDPHPSNDIIIDPTEYNDFRNITNTNFNAPDTTPDEYNYSTRNIVRKYINFDIISDPNTINKYNPVIIFKRFSIGNIPQLNLQLSQTNLNEIRLNSHCCFYQLLPINGININNAIIYTKSFNEKPKIKDYVDSLVSLINEPITIINNYMESLISNLKSVSQEDFIIKFIIIHCFYNSQNTNLNPNNKLTDIINILFDLKKSGDWGQSLFCSEYNKKFSPNKDCFFISGDKLSAARSIMTGNVKTITATDFNSVFSKGKGKNSEKRAVLTLYRNGELMTFKYFITFLQKNILSFIAFQHIKIHHRYFIKPSNLINVSEDDLITNNNFNFLFFNYFMLIIIYQLRIFYNTYTIIELKTSNKIPFESSRYEDCFYDKYMESLSPSKKIEIKQIFKFPDDNNILKRYINEDILESIYNIINNYDTQQIDKIIFGYLNIIDNYYDSPARTEKQYFETVDNILLIDILRIVDTKMNINPKVSNIKENDDIMLINNEYNAYYNSISQDLSNYQIYNKYKWLIINFSNDFSNCKNLINTISSYNNICAMLLVDEEYNNNDFINIIKTKYNSINIDAENSRKRKLSSSSGSGSKSKKINIEQKTEIKTMINNFYDKTIDLIDKIKRYFTNMTNFQELSLDVLLDVYENNIIDYNYVNNIINNLFLEVNKYLPEDKRDDFIFVYYTYGKITHSKGQEYKDIINDFKQKIIDIWAIYPELNLETKFTQKTLSEYEEKIYKDYIKFIKDPNIKPPPKNTISKTIKKTKLTKNTLQPLPIPVQPPVQQASLKPKPKSAPLKPSLGTKPKKSASVKTPAPGTGTKPKKSGPSKPAPGTGTKLAQSRTGRTYKPSSKFSQGGVPKTKNDEKKNKLSFRLYSYFITEIITHYNYNLCIIPPNITSNEKDNIIKIFKDILINVYLQDIICVKYRITYYNEPLLYRIGYINEIINDILSYFLNFITTKINNFIITNGFNAIDEIITNYTNIDALNANIRYIQQVKDELLSIITYYEKTIELIEVQTVITQCVNYNINSPLNLTLNIIKQNLIDIMNINKIIKDYDFSNNSLALKDSIIYLANYEDSFKSNTYNIYYNNIYLPNIVNYKSNISREIALKNINILIETISLYLADTNINEDLIMKLIFTIAQFTLAVVNFVHIYKNEIMSGIIILNNNIITEIYNYCSLIEKYINEIDIKIKIFTQQEIIDAINIGYKLINTNNNIIVLIYSYLFILFNINNINYVYSTSLKPNIDELNRIVYNTTVNNQKINKITNKYLELYSKQREIEDNINKLYPNNEEFKEKKSKGHIPILIQSEVFPSNLPSLFLKKQDLLDLDKSKKLKTNGPSRPSRFLDLEIKSEENKEILLDKTNINSLYQALLTKAKKEKPINVNITDSSLSKIFDTYFMNVNILGTKIIKNERAGQGAATSAYTYNENIIIQDIIFITIIANHFKEIIEYKGKKIFEIINTIEKDNTYKIHSFIKSKNSYYNQDNYKILTIVYACLYNIIKIKHDSLITEKAKGRDRYNFIGYYGKNNKYSDVEKLFSMFDVITEITKSI